MSGFVRGCFLLSFMIAQGSPALERIRPGTQPRATPEIRIRIFNYAGVAQGVLAGAKEQAGRVLRKVNVETVWVDCPASLAELQTNTACRGRPTATELVIRIIPRSQNPRCRLGFAALPTEKGQVASQAGVFFEAAEELAAGHPTSTAQMLGYILAHEIGHLLLGEGSHSGKGIMRTPWLTQEMDDLARGWLGFTARQAKRMKADLLARGRLVATAESLSLRPGSASETTVQRLGPGGDHRRLVKP